MAPPLPVDDVIRTRIIGTKGPDSWGIGMYWHANVVAGPYTDAQMTDVANSVFTNWVTNFSIWLTTDVSIQKCIAEDLTTGSAAIGLSTTGAIGGSLAGTPLPSGVAAVMNFGIASRYRGGHPRVYIPPPNEAYQADARSWTPTYRSDMEAAWAAFDGAVQTSSVGAALGLGHVAVRYHSHGAPLVPPQVFDVAVLTMSPILGSQRRRYNR